jgi:hypothetical protein
MSATADPLNVFFILIATLLVCEKYSWPRALLAAVFFTFGLLTKESAIVFPALLVAVLFVTSERKWASWRTYVITLPYWLMALGYFILRHTVLHFGDEFAMYKTGNIYTENILYRIYTFFATLPSYVELIFWPHDLHIDRQFSVFIHFTDVAVLTGFAIYMLGLAALVWAWFQRTTTKTRWTAFAFLWFTATYIPCSGILIPVNSLFLEHWMYLPGIGLSLALAGGLSKVVNWKRAAIYPIAVLSAGVIIALGAVTYEQNFVWESPVTLFTNILQYNPKADRIRHNLAMAYDANGDLDRALQEYQTVLSHTEEYPQTFNNVAFIYLRRNQLDLAEKYYLLAIRASPRFHPAFYGLYQVETARGNKLKADGYYQSYLELTK